MAPGSGNGGNLKRLVGQWERMLEPTTKLYLQQRRYLKFSIKGPAGWYGGVSIKHVAGTGGHQKNVNENPKFDEMVGKFKITSHSNLAGNVNDAQRVGFALPSDGMPVIVEFNAADLSGTFDFHIVVDKEEKYVDNPREFNPGNPEKYWLFKVDFIYQPGLESLYRYNDPNLLLYQGGDEKEYHTSENSHFGTKELIEKILEVGRLFNARFPGSKVWVNDISLPWGGTFRTKNNFSSNTHKEHKKGQQVDLSFNNLDNGEQRIWLDKVIQKVFAENSYEFHGPRGQWHWHCSVSKNDSKKQGMFDALIELHKEIKSSEPKLFKFKAEVKKRGIEENLRKAELQSMKLPRPSSSIKWQFDKDWIEGKN